MKKTIVAAAVAAVFAAPAMADVSISGQINQEFFDAGADMQSDSNVDVVIKGSEDLGNGMKASFKIADVRDDGNGSSSADQYVGLSGDFGSITAGRFEPYTESKVVAMAANDASDALTIETNLGNQTRAEGGMRYVSPNMNGFKVGFEGFAEENSAGDDFATTTIFAEYSNGPLLVRVANEETKSDAVDAVAADLAVDPIVVGSAAVAAVDNEIMTAAVQYKMGDTTFRVVHSDLDGGDDEQFYGVAHNMGANTIALSAINSDTATDGDYIVSFKHAMSKKTAVYVAVENDDSASDDTTLVGIQHKF